MLALIVVSFVYGSVVGSFLNVVLYRFGTGLTLGGRSMCNTCGKKLRAPELVPILSYLVLRGSCGGCKSKISIQYPLVEIAAGAIAVLTVLGAGTMTFPSFYHYGAWILLTSLVHITLLAIFVYDMRHTIIPDTFSALFAGLSLVLLFLGLHTISTESLLSVVLAGPLLALPFALLWLISRGKWIGFGDAKLALGIGWYLGLSSGIASLLFAFWLGAGVGIALMLYQALRSSSVDTSKRVHMKTELPFAPFLIIGVWIVTLWGIAFTDILSAFEVLLNL